MDFISLVLITLLLIFFFTPSKYLGYGGWGLGLLLIVAIALYFDPRHAFNEWLTWGALVGGVTCLGIWGFQRVDVAYDHGDEPSK